MDEGRYPHMSALARAEGVTPAAVSKALLRLKAQATFTAVELAVEANAAK
jgi:hypothetical protein